MQAELPTHASAGFEKKNFSLAMRFALELKRGLKELRETLPWKGIWPRYQDGQTVLELPQGEAGFMVLHPSPKGMVIESGGRESYRISGEIVPGSGLSSQSAWFSA